MKTSSLLRITFLACLWVACFAPLQAQQSSEKLTRDDWTELYGNNSGMEDLDNARQASPSPSTTPAGEFGLRTNACPSAFILNTPYNSNNGQRGCMFDITATNAVTIRCFESNLYSGTTANYEIYYRAGTHVGNENNSAAWTFIGGATGITSAGNNVPTALPIPVNVTIPAGQTYAFYITNDFGGGTSYTDGTAVGTLLASDANITVFEGVGKSYPFGLTFTVRNFNGHIFYDLGGSLDASEISLNAQLGDQGPELDWELNEELSFDALSLERSADGLDFEHLSELPLQNNGSFVDHNTGGSPSYFYRIRMTKPSGETLFSNAIEVQLGGEAHFELAKAYPNPFATQLHLNIQNFQGEEVSLQVIDRMGRVVFEEKYAGERGQQKFSPSLGHLASGMYTMRLRSGTTIQHRSVIRL